MKNKNGFTLIETLVYTALFVILIGGAVAVAYGFFESAGRTQGREILQQEGDFLVGKIEWALSGVDYINNPPDGIPLNTLQVTKYGGSSVTINTSEDCSGSTVTENIFLQKGGNCLQLNSSSVKVSNLIFNRRAASGGGINPESVSASFTLTARTENGMSITQDFSTTKYLRK